MFNIIYDGMKGNAGNQKIIMKIPKLTCLPDALQMSETPICACLCSALQNAIANVNQLESVEEGKASHSIVLTLDRKITEHRDQSVK